MILDTGICSVFRSAQAEIPSGYMPTLTWQPIGKSWYSELSFSTQPEWATEQRRETRVDQRIRIHQMRGIREQDRVVLADVDTLPEDGTPVYDIVRAYHGQDDDSPALITDLSLTEVMP